jgi:hypothetical protein
MNRPTRAFLTVVAFAALTLTLSACIVVKPGSVQPSQPGGIGNVNIDFKLCNATDNDNPPPCQADNYSGEAQVVLAFLVPTGSTNIPGGFTASPPGPGVAPLVFRRDQAFEANFKAHASYPPGFDVIGYVSEVTKEETGDAFEWGAKYTFGLPAAADGGSFSGPLQYFLVYGWREVNSGEPASRPVECESETSLPGAAECTSTGLLEFGVSDLRIKPLATTSVFAGAAAALPFSLDFASSAAAPPSSFGLSAATTLPGAAAAPSELTFVPGPLDSSKRSAGQRQVNVQVPANAKAGTYQVQLTATTATGGSVSAVAQLEVKRAKVGIKAKLNKAKGTAQLSLKVPAAGALTVSGKGIAKVQRKASGPKTVKVTVKAKGKAKKKLLATGKAKVTAKIKFRPTGAAPVTQAKPLTLKLVG